MKLPMINQLLSETHHVSGEQQIKRLKMRIKKLTRELADLPTNPGSQAGYDALDDAKSELKDAKEKLARLEKAHVKEAASDAAAAYDQRHKQVTSLIGNVGDLLSRHAQEFSKTPNNWGYAGDLAHVAEKLQEVIDFLSNEDR